MVEDGAVEETGGAQVLDALLAALAAWPEYESRARVSIEQWDAFSADEAEAYQDLGISAIQSVSDVSDVSDPAAVADRIRTLGQMRYEAAVPTLIELWEHCPIHPVAVAAAHALFEIGSDEARNVLRQGIHDHDHLGRFMALKVMFSDEGTAWDNVSHLFADECLATAAGQIAATDALFYLSPWSYSASGPEWHSDELRDLISRDRRWLDLCVDSRDDEILGGQAREVLKYADPAVTGPALDAAGAARAARPQPAAPPLRAGDLVARYGNGDHRGVWRELAAVAHLDDAWRAEAEQVAALTMERVRRNAVSLTTALIARGWPVSLDKALPGPDPDVEERLSELERITGTAVPPALAAYWRIVGSIDLVPRGTWGGPFPPGVPEQLTIADPLEIGDLAEAWYSVDEWLEEAEEVHPEIAGPVELEIAADYLHKANISGGAPYSVWLPHVGADPLVRYEKHCLTFTEYLRRAFAGKGFLRLDELGELDGQDEHSGQDGHGGHDKWLASVAYEHVDF